MGVIFAVLLVYLLLARSGSGDIFSLSPKQELYGLLTHGLAAGHLRLQVEPSAELLSLPNPYDPVANTKYRLHDASLYQGHYYVYFGLTPVLVLFLPFHLLTGKDLSDALATFLFAGSGYLLSCLLFLKLARKVEIRLPQWVELLAFLTLGLAQFVPFTVKRPLFYEVAITAGYFFSMGALLALAVAFERPRFRRANLLVAGLCLGLAVGSRPSLALGAVLLVCAVFARGLMARWMNWRDGIVFACPVVLCGLGMIWYNYARFQNPLEFGINYQLTDDNGFIGFHAHLANFAYGLFYFIFSPPLYSRSFPYVYAVITRPGADFLPGGLVLEQVVGMLPAVPLTVLGLIAPAILWLRPARERITSNIRFVLLAVWILAMANMLVLCASGWTTVRYSVDFVPCFLLTSWVLIALMFSHSGVWKWLIVTTSVYGVALGLLLGLTGYFDGTLFSHPKIYQKVAREINRLTGGETPALSIQADVEGSIQFANNLDASTYDPILTAGHIGSATYLAVRYLGSGRAVFSYQLWGEEEVLGAPFAIQPGRTYQVQVLLRPEEQRLRINLDQHPVFDRNVEFNPTRLDEVALGINPAWKLRRRQAFSGKFEVMHSQISPSSLWLRNST